MDFGEVFLNDIILVLTLSSSAPFVELQSACYTSKRSELLVGGLRKSMLLLNVDRGTMISKVCLGLCISLMPDQF
jgi:hypothetical protein